MATLNQRITELEQLHTKHKVLYPHMIGTYTDDELLDYLGLPNGAMDDQLKAIINEGAHHGE